MAATPDEKAPPASGPVGSAPPGPPAAPPRKEVPPDPLKAEVPSVALDRLRAAHAGALGEVAYHAGQVSVRVAPAALLSVLRFLRDDEACRFDLLMDLCGVDWVATAERFEINYHLYSIPRGHFLRVKARFGEGEAAPSVTSIWTTADWFEREIFDLFGLTFTGHPDLRRILLPEDWRGHPLRKEYPLAGYPDQHLRLR